MHHTARLTILFAISLTPGFAIAQTPLRLITWNVEGVGAPGTSEYAATLAILGRLDPDVIGINEVSSSADEGNLAALASDAGYGYVFIAPSPPFGGQRNAVVSRYPFVSTVVATAATLSQDPSANDLTREVILATIDLPGAALDPTIAVMHYKSGSANSDEFRRAVESLRVVQSLSGLDPNSDAFLVVGDFNEEVDDVPGFPAVFTSLPSGLPGSYVLGADLAAVLSGPGIDNDPFAPLTSAQLTALDALQIDGTDVTRPSSGRRLDYVFASAPLLTTTPATEVYDANDEALPGGLPKAGAPLSPSTSAIASDHLPVIADLVVPDAGTPPPPPPPPPPAGGTVWINELHYDNAGADSDEAVEIAGVEGTDLSGWSLVFYNGNGGGTYDTVALSGTLANQSNGHGFLAVAAPGLQNGAPDGVALVDDTGATVEFISYEGVLTAQGGPADGMTSVDIGVEESPTTPVGTSLQRVGHGSTPADFTWAPSAMSTFGSINVDQSLVCTTCPPNVWINELHYDNAGADTAEGVEIAGTGLLDLTGWTLVAYNGNDGGAYASVDLSGATIPLMSQGLGVVFFALPGLQNGAPDAIALVDDTGAVIELLSYEGTMVCTDGPAVGLTSTDIGVSEDGSTPSGWSLQRTGVGGHASAFTWTAAQASTYDATNTGQTFSP